MHVLDFDSLVWVQQNIFKHFPIYIHLSGSSDDERYVADSKTNLESHLSSKRKQTAGVVSWRCTSWVQTAPSTSHKEQKTHLSYILHASLKNTQTNQNICSCWKQYSSCSAYSCRPKELGLHQHVRGRIQTFIGGWLGSHRSSLSPRHPHIKDSLRMQRSILAPAEEGTQEVLL